MKELTSEQRKRVNQHKVFFRRIYEEETEKQCLSLWDKGYATVAVQILCSVKGISEEAARIQLINGGVGR